MDTCSPAGPMASGRDDVMAAMWAQVETEAEAGDESMPSRWAQVETESEAGDEAMPWADLLVLSPSSSSSHSDHSSDGRDLVTPSTDCCSDSNSGSPAGFFDADARSTPESTTSQSSEATEEWLLENDAVDMHAAATLLPLPAGAGGHDRASPDAWLRSLSTTLRDLPAPEPLHLDDRSAVKTEEELAGPPSATASVVAVAHVAAPPVATGGRAGGRRTKKKSNGGCCPLCNEQHDRLSRFWRKFGYGGPAYCLRCAELFRSHQLTCSVKSDTCSREQPCGRCAKVFVHFTKPLGEAFAAMDKAQPLSRERAGYVRPGGDGHSACPLCSRTEHGGLGVFWKTFGYTGPPYCTACSTSFRNHIIRRRGVARTGCSRDSPCSDCERVLVHFTDRESAFERMGSGVAARGAAAAVSGGAGEPTKGSRANAAAPVVPPPAPAHPPPPQQQAKQSQGSEPAKARASRSRDVEMQQQPPPDTDLNPIGVAVAEQQDIKRQRRHERVGAAKALGAVAVVAMGCIILLHMSGGSGADPLNPLLSPQPTADDAGHGQAGGGGSSLPPAATAASGVVPLCDVGGGNTGRPVLYPSSSSSSSSSSSAGQSHHSFSSSAGGGGGAAGKLARGRQVEEEGKSSAALSTGSFRSPRGGGGGGGVGGGFGLCQVRSVEQLKRAVDADAYTCVDFTAPWCSGCDVYASRLLSMGDRTDLFQENNVSLVQVNIASEKVMDALVEMGVVRSASKVGRPVGWDANVVPANLFPSVALYRKGQWLDQVGAGPYLDVGPVTDMLQKAVFQDEISRGETPFYLPPPKIYLLSDADSDPLPRPPPPPAVETTEAAAALESYHSRHGGGKPTASQQQAAQDAAKDSTQAAAAAAA